MVRVQRRLARRARYLRGKSAGAWYRVCRRHPDPGAPDAVLEQRVRSELGPLEHELDLPRVHVTVTDGLATLHGPVGSVGDRATIEDFVLEVPGITGIRSYLHVGMARGDTRPSQGRPRQGPSHALRDLMGGVRALGIGDDEAVQRLLGATLAAFLGLLPSGERAHVEGHLPIDVRVLATRTRRFGRHQKPRTPEALIDQVREDCGCLQRTARDVVNAVLATLRDLLPDEARDIEAVLPGELKPLWAGRVLATTP